MSSGCLSLGSDSSFGPFYVAAYAVALVLLYLEGRRRAWPLSSWLVLVAAVVTLGIVGSRLGAISLVDWRAALAHGSLPTTTGKTFIGLIVLGTAGALLLQRFLGFQSTTGDAFALALPAGMALVRLGCTLGGCCFGKPTSLPWAITYPPGSLAATVHELRGLVLPGHSALPVHPVQLYEIGLLAIVVLALVGVRRTLRQPGSLFLLYLVLHGWVRFLTEFVREDAIRATLLGLRPLQVGLVVFCAGCAVLLVLKERAPVRPRPAPAASSGRNFAVLGAMAVLLCVFGAWFTPVEQLVLAGAGLPAFLVSLFGLVRLMRGAWSRRAVLAAACGSVILLGAGSDWLPPLEDEYLEPPSYYDVSLFGGTGSYHEACGGTYRYDQVGIGIARTERLGEYDFKYGVQGFRYSERGDYYYGIPSYVRYAVRPFVSGEHRWAGLEAGVLYYELGSQSGADILPSGRLRLGPSDVVFLEAAYLTHRIGYRPMASLGIGTSNPEWGSFRAGLCNEGIFVEPEFYTDIGLSVTPFASYGGGDVWQLGLGLQYNFRDLAFRPVHRGEY